MDPCRCLLVLLFFAWATPLAGRDDSPSFHRLIERLPCFEELERQLEAWRATEEVFRGPPGRDGEPVYRIATETFGAWVTLRAGRGERYRPSLVHVDPAGTTVFALDEACRAESRHIARDPVGEGSLGWLTDRDLDGLLKRSPDLVVYHWSPHLPLSVEGYAQIEAAAASRRVGFVAVVHPSADEDFTVRAAEEAGIPPGGRRRLASVELFHRDLTVHAPSVLVFVEGRAEAPLPGYRSEAGYLEYLDGLFGGN